VQHNIREDEYWKVVTGRFK